VQLWTLKVMNDDAPRSFYKYSTITQELELLWVDRPQLLNYTLSTMEGVVIQARDGTALPSYLSLPPMPVRFGFFLLLWQSFSAPPFPNVCKILYFLLREPF
jgi:hypothetical protein